MSKSILRDIGYEEIMLSRVEEDYTTTFRYSNRDARETFEAMCIALHTPSRYLEECIVHCGNALVAVETGLSTEAVHDTYLVFLQSALTYSPKENVIKGHILVMPTSSIMPMFGVYVAIDAMGRVEQISELEVETCRN